MPKFTRGDAVTVPSLSFKGREVIYARFLTEIRVPGNVSDSDDGREPAHIARVVDLETGEIVDLICPALLVSAMLRQPDKYVGKNFEIRCDLKPRPGKRYRDVSVFHIEVDNEPANPANEA